MIFRIFARLIVIGHFLAKATTDLRISDVQSSLPYCTPHYFIVNTRKTFVNVDSCQNANMPGILSFIDETSLEVDGEQIYEFSHDGTHLRKKLCWLLIFYFDRLPSTLIRLHDFVKIYVRKYFNRLNMNNLIELEKSQNPENIFTVLGTEKLEKSENVFSFLKAHLPELVMVSTLKVDSEICWPAICDAYQYKSSGDNRDRNLNLATAIKNIPSRKAWYYYGRDTHEYSQNDMFLRFGTKDRNPFEISEMHDYIVYTITRIVNASLHNYVWNESPLRWDCCNAMQCLTRNACPIPIIR